MNKTTKTTVKETISMKKIISMLLAILMVLTLCSCGKKKICDFCGEEYSGNTYNLNVFGRGYVCKNCYDILCGRAGASMDTGSDTIENLPKACISDAKFGELIESSYSTDSLIVISPTPTPTIETQILSHSWVSGETYDLVEAIVSEYYETYIDISYIKQGVYWYGDSWELERSNEVTKRIYDFSPLNGTWTGSYRTNHNFRPEIAVYTFEISNAGKIELSGNDDSGSTTITVAHNINDTFKDANTSLYFSQGEMPLVLKYREFVGTLPVEGSPVDSFKLKIFKDSIEYSGIDIRSLTLKRA